MLRSSTGALGGQKGICMGGEPHAGARDPAVWDGTQQGTRPEWVSEPEEGEEVAHGGWYQGASVEQGLEHRQRRVSRREGVLQAQMCPPHPHPHPKWSSPNL